MSGKIILETKLIKTDIDNNNNNKYWYAAVYDDGTWVQENGRVGAENPQRRTENLGVDAATKKFNAKVAEKKRGRNGEKPYVEAQVLSGSNSPGASTVVTKTKLESVAIKEIDHNSPEVAQLIKKLSAANIHDIVKESGITYDEKNGDFRTPMGIVTQSGIDSARLMLDLVSDMLVKKISFDSSEFKKLTGSYMEIIPQNVGRHKNSRFGVVDVFPDMQAVQKQLGILDALDASLQKVLTTTAPTTTDSAKQEDKVFSVKLHLVSDKSLFDRISKKFQSTLNRGHTSSSLKLKRVFTVEIEHMKHAFDKKAPNVGNIMELWHGTRTANLLSILKGGLIIPKSGAAHVTGRMFGDGVYFSDQSTKSLNYSQGYWSRGSGYDNNCYMFLADVAMGKYFVPKTSGRDFPRQGYDSTFAKAGESSVMNNEMIVYGLNQCNLTFLCEFDQ